MADLDVLPRQTETHVDGRYLAPLARQMSNQNRTVEAAARQHGDGICLQPPHLQFAPVDATRVARLADDHLGELWQRNGQPLPDPASQHLTGRILKTVDLVQVVVIEHSE